MDERQIENDNSETSVGMDFGLDDEFVSIDRQIDELAAEMVDVDGSEEAPEEPPSELDRQIAANILKRQKKRSRPSPFKVACGIIILTIAMLVFMSTGVFTIDSIQVEGNDYFTDEEIINMAHATTGKNLFYHSGSREIVEYLEGSPYIEEAKVSKRIPGTLVIRVKEREQIAAVVYNKEYLVVDSQGLLLRRSKTKPKVTIVTGIKIRKMELGEKLEVTNSKEWKSALRILNAMNEGDLYFKKLKVSDDTARGYVYDSMVCKGRVETMIESIEKERLQKVLEALFKKGIKRGTVTLTESGYASFEPKV